MRGMCQTCGATAPLEWFLSEPVSRQVLTTALKLPQAVQEQLLGYLALFRPTGGSMQPKKALRLVTEIAQLAATGHCQVAGKPARPCPPRVWSQAMEQMQEKRATLQLPLKNHNYLRQIAWGLADQEDARAEAARHEQNLSGARPRGEGKNGDGLLPVERAILAKGGTLKRMEE